MTREEAIDVLIANYPDACYAPLREAVDLAIEVLSTAPKMGQWIEHNHKGLTYMECSNCGDWFLLGGLTRLGYCTNCGAKMIERG